MQPPRALMRAARAVSLHNAGPTLRSRACAAPAAVLACAVQASVNAKQPRARRLRVSLGPAAPAAAARHAHSATPAAPQAPDLPRARSRPAAGPSPPRQQQLEALQAQLGYRFRDVQLLAQACTHDSSGLLPSYRQLAFVGDAALWLLFAEHAFRAHGASEDPISGSWPGHLSALLSRANCAATARQWGLDAYLQHSSEVMRQREQERLWLAGGEVRHSLASHAGSSSSSSLDGGGPLWVGSAGSGASGLTALSRCSSLESSASSSLDSSSLDRSGSSSSSRAGGSKGSGMHAGVWTTDSLAEMFEGVVGALLLDCGGDFEVLKQLLLPWVAASFDAARAAAAAAPADAHGVAGGVAAPTAAAAPAEGLALGQHAVARAAGEGISSCSDGGAAAAAAAAAAQQRQAHERLHAALEGQLLRACGYAFDSREALWASSGAAAELLLRGLTGPRAETLRFVGFSVLQFAAALLAADAHLGLRCAPQGCVAGSSRWGQEQLPLPLPPQQQQHAYGAPPAAAGWSGCWQQQWPADARLLELDAAAAAAAAAAGGGVGVGAGVGGANAMHLTAKYSSQLTTVRHRAKMWLGLLEAAPAGWCPPEAAPGAVHILAASWKQQKQGLARCLDLALAAVYVDGGLGAALRVARALLAATPPTTHDKSWMPAWTRGGGGGGARQRRRLRAE